MSWQVIIERKAQKEFKKLNPVPQKQIKKYLAEKISNCSNPRIYGKPLSGNFSGYWRYRIGNYRAVCYHDENLKIVKVLKISHRRNVYTY